jgi:hypothetical protein
VKQSYGKNRRGRRKETPSARAGAEENVRRMKAVK